MPVIAVINRKGGSGKSTLATHIAAFLANHDTPVMLGDIDRQQSSKTWLRLRGDGHKPIVSWAVDHQNVRRLPTGVQYAIIDTPGGLHGFDLAKVVMFADYIVMPVCGSIFDRESASDCLAELRKLPRIITGKCKLGVVGMRVEARAGAALVVEDWAHMQQIPVIASITESRPYITCIEQGLTLFDVDTALVQNELEEWKPLLRWLAPEVMHAREYAQSRFPVESQTSRLSQFPDDALAENTVQSAKANVIPMPPRSTAYAPPVTHAGPGVSTPRESVAFQASPPVLQRAKPSMASSLVEKPGKSGWFDSTLIPAFLRANKT